MVEKLKSIAKQIHWSLLLKVGLFLIVWSVCPTWLSMLVGALLYFVPLFRPGALLVSFLVFLCITTIFPHTVFFGIVVGILLFLILGIKDFLFVDRNSAYEILALMEIAIMYLYTFGVASTSGGSLQLLSIIPAGICVLLFMNMGKYAIPFSLFGFFLWQLAVVLLTAPIPPIYQAVIEFLATLFLIESFLDYTSKRLTKERAIIYLLGFFSILVIILSSIEWGLA